MLLNCHTYYSLRYGTISIQDLLALVQQKGYHTFVLADINNTTAAVEMLRLAAATPVKPLIGIDFRNGIIQQYVGIAKNNMGFTELNTHLSFHLHHNRLFDAVAPAFLHAYVIYPFSAYNNHALQEHEFVGVTLNDLKKIAFTQTTIPKHKLVLLQTVSFTNKISYNTHRLLRAIDTNTLLSKLPVTEQASADDVMPDKEQLYACLKNYPEIVHNTEALLRTCSVEIAYGKFSNKNLKHYTGTEVGDMQLLTAEATKGLSYRYGNKTPDVVLQRMHKELGIIQQMGFASYFLINWDIVNYARSKNYYYVGRGSGANSLVAYLIRITDVDPIELDLYFERFINPSRTNPPDFDIDFSWLDRDDITDYIFNRFGQNGKAALVGTYTTFKTDSAIRELGKVFGLPPNEIEALQKNMPVNATDDIVKYIAYYSKYIEDFPSNISIHASGILISEEPINTYVSTFMPPKGYPTTHFSMLEAEDIGLYKFDILSQRGLGKIKDTLELIKQNQQTTVDLHKIDEILKDEKIKHLLRYGKALGCFYVESPGMRMLLCKLQADDYLRLVAASSIIRPGVAKSGMMREYILRYRNPDLRKQAHDKLPELYNLLQETYGVMVYQEDVIKIAHLFADLTLAEADYLRRGMSWKFKQRNEFNSVRDKFFANCTAKKYNEKTISDIWTQIESFANFAFSKGHSASYAVESYQALYLKAHYPIEYMLATINNGGGFFRTDVYVNELRLHGAEVNMPCVNQSTELGVLDGKTVYLGLSLITGLEKNTIDALIAERNKNGQYTGLNDFVTRVPISIEQIRVLIRSGGFNFTKKTRQQLLWDVHMYTTAVKTKTKTPELFTLQTAEYTLPKLFQSTIDEAFDEMEYLGFTRKLPFYLLKEALPSKLCANDLNAYLNKTIQIVGYLVNKKTTITTNGQKMYFGTFLDLQGHWIDTVHFPNVASAYPFTGTGCYLITGKVTEEFDFCSIEVNHMQRLFYHDREKAMENESNVDNQTLNATAVHA